MDAFNFLQLNHGAKKFLEENVKERMRTVVVTTEYDEKNEVLSEVTNTQHSVLSRPTGRYFKTASPLRQYEFRRYILQNERPVIESIHTVIFWHGETYFLVLKYEDTGEVITESLPTPEDIAYRERQIGVAM